MTEKNNLRNAPVIGRAVRVFDALNKIRQRFIRAQEEEKNKRDHKKRMLTEIGEIPSGFEFEEVEHIYATLHECKTTDDLYFLADNKRIADFIFTKTGYTADDFKEAVGNIGYMLLEQWASPYHNQTTKINDKRINIGLGIERKLEQICSQYLNMRIDKNLDGVKPANQAEINEHIGKTIANCGSIYQLFFFFAMHKNDGSDNFSNKKILKEIFDEAQKDSGSKVDFETIYNIIKTLCKKWDPAIIKRVPDIFGLSKALEKLHQKEQDKEKKKKQEKYKKERKEILEKLSTTTSEDPVELYNTLYTLELQALRSNLIQKNESLFSHIDISGIPTKPEDALSELNKKGIGPQRLAEYIKYCRIAINTFPGDTNFLIDSVFDLPGDINTALKHNFSTVVTSLPKIDFKSEGYKLVKFSRDGVTYSLKTKNGTLLKFDSVFELIDTRHYPPKTLTFGWGKTETQAQQAICFRYLSGQTTIERPKSYFNLRT